MGLDLEPLDGMIMATWDEVDDEIGIHHYKVIVTAAGGFSLTMGSGSADTEYTIEEPGEWDRVHGEGGGGRPDPRYQFGGRGR